MAGLDDYGALIQSGQNLVPDFLKQGLERAQIGEANAATQQAQAQAAEVQQKQRRMQLFQQALAKSDGSPSAVASMMMQFPEVADHLKDAANLRDKAATDADLTTTAEIYSAATSGKWDLAKKLAHQRADADKASGITDPPYAAALDSLDKAADGDPAEQKFVLNTLGLHLAATTGAEHFGTVYNAVQGEHILHTGDVVVDRNGNITAHSPVIQDANGRLLDYDSVMGGGTGKGGDPSSGGSATPGGQGGFDRAVEFSLKHEGGYNPSDMNGAPVNFGINQSANPGVDVKSLTKDQATQIYKTKYWDKSGAANLPAAMQTPYFDTYIINPSRAQAFLAKSGDDPNKFMDMREAWMKSVVAKHPEYAEAYATRNADLRATIAGTDTSQPYYAGGSAAPASGPRVLLPGRNDPGQYRTLTPDEVKTRGLDASQQYQLNTKTGEVTGLGKVDPADQPIPGDSTKTGPAYLATVPQNLATQVKALAEGRLPMPSSFALAKPYWQRLLQMTAQYDPTFDAANAPARKAAITAFTGNGKAAQVIGSVNRVANHLDLLWNESKRLAGPDTGFGPLNTALAAAGQAFEPADAKAYDTEVTFVAGELGKIAKAGVVTEGEVSRIINNLSRKQSLPTREAAIKAAVGIISGAVDPLKDQYNSAFTNDSTRPNIPWVSPRAQHIYSKIAGIDTSLTSGNADTNATTGSGKTVVRTGKDKAGRRVVQYSDGSLSYAN